jgi:hypothetical protein
MISPMRDLNNRDLAGQSGTGRRIAIGLENLYGPPKPVED